MQGRAGSRARCGRLADKTMSGDEHLRPRGFAAMGLFFVFGATMAAYAAVTLLEPGTALDRLWALNKTGHAHLALLGKTAAPGFAVLSATLAVTFRRLVPAPPLGMDSRNNDHRDQRGG